jgi:hypothetical protein
MSDEYWGKDVDPDNDDFDKWMVPDKDAPAEPAAFDDDDDEEIEEQQQRVDDMIDDVGPSNVIEGVADYLCDLERPYHRIAKQLRDLAERIDRTVGAVEEARQTRGRT